MDKQQKASYELAQKIAPAVKADIIAYNGGTEWGYYNHETDTIHINVNAKWSEASMMTYTMAHELVHRAKKGSYKQFKAFADFLMEQYGKQGADVDEMIGQQMDAADAFDKTVPESQRINMTPEMALEEVICDAAQRMLLDTSAGEKLAQWGAQSQENKGFLAKLKQIITDLLNRLRSYFKNVDPESLPAKAFAKIDANAKQILADMFVDMSIDAGEKLSTIKEAGLSIKNTAPDGGRKYKSGYDYTKSFAQQIDDFKAGLIPKGDTLLLGGTPNVYQSIGFNALPMTINATHVDYALNGTKDADHFMGEAALKQLPESIKKPVAVFISQTHGTTSVIALLNFKVNGKQTVAPIVIDGYGKNNSVVIDSNAITSVYGKTTAVDQLYQAVKDDAAGKFALLYANKKEAISLLQRAGHQLSGTQMPHDGFYHSIREKNSPVKPKFNNVTETQQFKRWFGDWMKHPNRASKIVNSDATPKVMYHGSPAQFTIFDKKKAKSSGQYGRGFYFTDSQSHANTYGQLYSVYLNIRNPLRHSGGTVSRSQVQKFLEAVAENEDYSIENYGTYDVGSVLQTVMGKASTIDAFQLIQDVSLTAIGDMVEAAELFNKVNGTKFDGIVAATETVAFYPEQIKSATDNIGTFDKANPDIRYKVPVEKNIDTNSKPSYDVSEDNDSHDPVYLQHRPGQEMQNIDHTAWQKKKTEAKSAYSLSEEEHDGVDGYVGGNAYALNAILRGDHNYERTEFADYWIQQTINGFSKFPQFAGRTYRNLSFTDQSSFDLFMMQHKEGMNVDIVFLHHPQKILTDM